MSLKAYQQVQTRTESPRETEYRLFAQVTGALIRAKERGIKDSEFVGALDWNRRMWSVFTTDCGLEGNGLPQDLRARIISIGIWVGKYTSEVIRAGGDIDALIDVNRAIMEGLAMRPQAESQMTPAEAPSPATV